MHHGVKLRHIHAFLAIAAHASLSAMARRRGISQPAQSRTLAEIEDLLGVAPIRREPRQWVPTEAGALCRGYASLGLQALEAAAMRPGGGGDIQRVGPVPTAATRLFPRVSLRFRQTHPGTFRIETGPQSGLLRLLRAGEIDLRIGRMPVASAMAGRTFEHLCEEEIILVACVGDPLAADPMPAILHPVPLILPPESALIRQPVNDCRGSLGLPGSGPAFLTVARATERGTVAGSGAVRFIARGVAAEEVARGGMTLSPTAARFRTGSVGITRRQAAPVVQGLDVLLQLCHDAMPR